MNTRTITAATLFGLAACFAAPPAGADSNDASSSDARWGTALDRQVDARAQRVLAAGRWTFRYDTFGDEAFWGDTLHLNDAIAGAANGGVGPGVSPQTALAVGLKVDAAALPDDLRRALQDGRVDLTSPASTLALLKLDAVIGVRGHFDATGQRLVSVGITCALCHSDVDNSLAPGIGRRLDGRAARDLDVGAIIALAPNVQPFVSLVGLVNPGVDAAAVRSVLRSWGPGKFDAELLLDGKVARPDGKPAATLIPPAFGLAGVNLHTWTGWGSVTHWNALVANLEMQGQGTFYDPRLADATKFPIAALAGFSDVRHDPDLVTGKLAPLHLYQLSLEAPPAPKGSFDATAAQRGAQLFAGKAECSRCHVPPLFTEPGWNMHTPAEIGIDDFQASRSPDGRYRTAPLKGLWSHAKGGYYHDGRYTTLAQVVAHYDDHFQLGLTPAERRDLVEYLKSL